MSSRPRRAAAHWPWLRRSLPTSLVVSPPLPTSRQAAGTDDGALKASGRARRCPPGPAAPGGPASHSEDVPEGKPGRCSPCGNVCEQRSTSVRTRRPGEPHLAASAQARGPRFPADDGCGARRRGAGRGRESTRKRRGAGLTQQEDVSERADVQAHL